MTGAETATMSRRREVVPSSVLGMLLFIGAEVMFFAGLISAFTITRAGAAPDVWNLPQGRVLPAGATAFNSAALLMSGVCVLIAGRRRRVWPGAAERWLLWAWLLGSLFVVLQGREWWGLLSQGLTVRSSPLAAFFYLIVGAHAVHAVGALLALGYAWWRQRSDTLTAGLFLGAQTFWYFVVAVWPIIYFRVYF